MIVNLLIITLTFFAMLNSHESFAQTKLIVACNENNVPVCFLDDNQKPTGIDVDIVKELSRRIGMEVEFRLIPWKRLLVEVRHGKVDSAMPLFMTEERKAFVRYPSEPIHLSTMTAFARQGFMASIRSVSDLHGKKVGIRRGYSISKDFDEAVKSGQIMVTEVSNVQNLMKMVSSGRIDVLIDKKNTIEYYLKKTNFSLVNIGDVSTGSAYLVFSRANLTDAKQNLLDRISEVLVEMKSDGAYKEIESAYLN